MVSAWREERDALRREAAEHQAESARLRGELYLPFTSLLPPIYLPFISRLPPFNLFFTSNSGELEELPDRCKEAWLDQREAYTAACEAKVAQAAENAANTMADSVFACEAELGEAREALEEDLAASKADLQEDLAFDTLIHAT